MMHLGYTEPNHVYIAKLKDAASPLKIGYSWYPTERMSHIAWAVRRPVELIYESPPMDRDDAIAVERLAKQRMSPNKVRGEWFSVSKRHMKNVILSSLDAVMSSKKMTHRDIIAKFSSNSSLARLLGHGHSSNVSYWKAQNRIPKWRWPEVLEAARKRGIPLEITDFE